MNTVANEIAKTYREYGFTCERKYLSEGVLIFTLNNGYFNNAEIVSLSSNNVAQKVFNDYTASGFACTLRNVSCAKEVENELFKGFFFVESTRDRLKSDYAKFTKSITSFYSSTAKYSYINAPYTLNNKLQNVAITQQIAKLLDSDRPALFLIEAAAGFGKTCTAYELVSEILDRKDRLPLFSELSRNRSAKIFRYVLLDEIDRTFPQLKSRLVEAEILKGRVVVVLDGFDELLRKSENGDDFETAEPMLETIGELLKIKAKIILTTRRTVLFEGDDFHRWMDQNVENFDVHRIRLSEPNISDWLPANRREELEGLGFNVDGIANPVLLSYLRCISNEEFSIAISNKDELVERYFDYMLERERVRQDLRLDANGQLLILKGIARDMIDFGYTSEDRDYIVDLIKNSFARLLDEVRSRYAATEKPSRDEVANKLASHALLDKSSSDDLKIGFINEFVFGTFVADAIKMDKAWMNDDLRFLEPAVISYVPRSFAAKAELSLALKDVMEFLDWNSRVDFSIKLGQPIDFELKSGEADGLFVMNQKIGVSVVSEFQFNECSFNGCEFFREKFGDVTFLNCKFYDCKITGSIGGTIHVLGCTSDDQDFLDSLSVVPLRSLITEQADGDQNAEIEKYVLEKFWPVGALNFHRRRPIKGICAKNNEFSPEELYAGISRLKKRGLIFEPSKPSFLEVSIERVGEIRSILGRTTP